MVERVSQWKDAHEQQSDALEALPAPLHSLSAQMDAMHANFLKLAGEHEVSACLAACLWTVV
jgi:hypothetical protein